MTSIFSWQDSVSHCPDSLVLQGQASLFFWGSLDFLLFHSSPLWWKWDFFFFFFMVLALEGLIGLHRTIQHQLLQCYWLEHRLGLLWYWMVCPGNKGRSFCCFWDCTQVLHFGLFYWLWGLLHFFSRILATVVHVMIIWIKSTHSHPF